MEWLDTSMAAPNKTNQQADRCSSSARCIAGGKMKTGQSRFELLPTGEEKHPLTCPQRGPALFLVDRQASQTPPSARSPPALPAPSRPGLCAHTGQRADPGRAHQPPRSETGSPAKGPTSCQATGFQGQRSQRRMLQIPIEHGFHQLCLLKRKILGPKAVIVLCLIFMVEVGRQSQHSPHSSLSNENHAIGVSSSLPIKTKDIRTFQRLQQRRSHLMGREALELRGRGRLWLSQWEELGSMAEATRRWSRDIYAPAARW